MIPQIIRLRGDVNELQELVSALGAKVDDQHAVMEIQQGTIELLTMRGDMMAAHVENLIERVHYLESGNPGALRRRTRAEVEATSTDTPVSPPAGDKNPAGW